MACLCLTHKCKSKVPDIGQPLYKNILFQMGRINMIFQDEQDCFIQPLGYLHKFL